MIYFRWLTSSSRRAAGVVSLLLPIMLSMPFIRALAAGPGLATGTSPVPGVGPASTQTDSGTLTVAIEARPRSVDPRFVSTDANSQSLEPLLFLPLFGFAEGGAPQGVLAESFRFSDAKTLIVRIREGVQFALGRNINSDDVVATYQFVLGQSGQSLPPSPRRGTFERVKTVVRLSDREVKFTLSQPDVSVVSNLVVGILPKEALQHPPNEVVGGKGYESGPFVLERQTDAEVVLARNEKYSGAPFGGAFPNQQRVVFKILPDSNTRYAALLKGDIDLIQNNLDPDKVLQIMNKRQDAFVVQQRVSDSTTFLAFNVKNKIFADVRVRKALGMAINREEILRFTMQGLGQLSQSMFPPGHAFHFENPNPLTFDPVAAKHLLDSAGFKINKKSSKEEHRFEFTIKVPLNRERVAVAKAIAGQLKKVGIRVKVEVLELNTFLKHLNEGNVQSWIAPWTGYKDGELLHFVFHSSRIPPSGANRGRYVNPALDRLLDSATGEIDPEARKLLYRQAQALIADDVPYIYLWHPMGHVVSRRSVVGYKIFPDARYSALTTAAKR